MTSKNSIYKVTTEQLRHSSWMLALSLIGNLLAGPIALLFAYSQNDYTLEYHSPEELKLLLSDRTAGWLSNLCSTLFLCIAMLGAVIVALGIFYYLFQSSRVDLYHSLPLTRKELFLGGYFAGLLIWLIPFLFSCLLTFPLAVFSCGGMHNIGSIQMPFIHMVLAALFGFILTYHLCLAAIMLSGNMANSIINALVFGLAPFVFYLLILMYCDKFFDSFYQLSVSEYIFTAISPIVTPITLLSAILNKEPAWILLLQLVAGCGIAAINFAAALHLYQKRSSELAGRGVEKKSAAFLVRFTAALAAGLFGVALHYLIGNSLRLVWLIFFTLFFSVFTSAVLSAVQKKSFKGLFSHKGQMAASAACAVCIIIIFRFDVFGYDAYLPQMENIEAAEIRINAVTNSYYSYLNEGLFPYDDTAAIHQLLACGASEPSAESYTRILVKVHPKFGLSYYRSYRIPTTDKDLLRPIVESEEYLSWLIGDYISSMPNLMYASIEGLNYRNDSIADTAQIQKLLQAYMQDLTTHGTLEELTEYHQVGSIHFRASEYNAISHLGELSIHDNYEHTIALLKEYTPDMAFTKEQLTVEAFRIHLAAGEEQSVEEYLTQELSQTKDTYDEAEEGTAQTYISYNCKFAREELDWLFDRLYIYQHYTDSLDEESYIPLMDVILPNGNQLPAAVKRGSLTTEEIQRLAGMIEENNTATY